MGYWYDWLLREVLALAALNIIVAGIGVWGRILVRLSPAVASGVAITAFVGLSLLNLASARRHAQPGRGVLWPLFLIYEVLAAGAAWAIWTSGAAA